MLSTYISEGQEAHRGSNLGPVANIATAKAQAGRPSGAMLVSIGRESRSQRAMAENANFAEVAVERVAVGAARRLAEAFPAHELVQEKEKKEKKEKKDKKEKKVLNKRLSQFILAPVAGEEGKD